MQMQVTCFRALDQTLDQTALLEIQRLALVSDGADRRFLPSREAGEFVSRRNLRQVPATTVHQSDWKTTICCLFSGDA